MGQPSIVLYHGSHGFVGPPDPRVPLASTWPLGGEPCVRHNSRHPRLPRPPAKPPRPACARGSRRASRESTRSHPGRLGLRLPLSTLRLCRFAQVGPPFTPPPAPIKKTELSQRRERGNDDRRKVSLLGWYRVPGKGYIVKKAKGIVGLPKKSLPPPPSKKACGNDEYVANDNRRRYFRVIE